MSEQTTYISFSFYYQKQTPQKPLIWHWITFSLEIEWKLPYTSRLYIFRLQHIIKMHILAFLLFESKQSDKGVVRCKSSFVYALCKLCKPDLEQGIILINMWYYHYKGWYRKAKTIMKLSKPHLVWIVQCLGVVKVRAPL